MNKLDFGEFSIKIYAESIYKTLKIAVEDKKVKEAFLKKEYKDAKEIESGLKKLSHKIAIKFVRILKEKGFPDEEITLTEQKRILKGIINEHIQTPEKQ
ncbi:MAG: hypothetical protein KAT05_08200 [Spirochaetes bacterium]|nr:hypothetical protein [Spirochaetota bacterium]